MSEATRPSREEQARLAQEVEADTARWRASPELKREVARRLKAYEAQIATEELIRLVETRLAALKEAQRRHRALQASPFDLAYAPSGKNRRITVDLVAGEYEAFLAACRAAGLSFRRALHVVMRTFVEHHGQPPGTGEEG
jgi:hypothetical protein